MPSQSTRVFCYNCKMQPLSYYFSILCLIIGYVLCIIGIIIDQLIKLTTEVATWTQDHYCGWERVHGEDEDISSDNDDYQYKDLCNDDDDNSNDFCDMEKGGQIWFGLSIAALIIGLLAWYGIFSNIYKKSKLTIMVGSFLFSLCCIGAILMWYIYEHCQEWCDSFGNIVECDSDFGTSIILMSIAAGMGLLSCICAAII